MDLGEKGRWEELISKQGQDTSNSIFQMFTGRGITGYKQQSKIKEEFEIKQKELDLMRETVKRYLPISCLMKQRHGENVFF